jgi:hypothetical protein
MDEVTERLIDDIGAYTEAAEQLIERLQSQVAWNRQDAERLRSGETLAQSTRATKSADRSRDLTRTLDGFEQSRRRIRASVSAAALAEGLSIAEIAEMFGVSRQLANRFVKEARNLPPRSAPEGQPA